MGDARIRGFHRRSIDGRIDLLVERGFIDARLARRLRSGGGMLTLAAADRMVENVIGVFGLPLAVAPNFLVNGREYVVPLVIEEPSVVAGLSAAAALIRDGGGFAASSGESMLIGQIHLADVDDPDRIMAALARCEAELLEEANRLEPRLVERGGGATALELRKLRLPDGGNAVVVQLLVDTCDAMGANIVNSMCEHIAGRVELRGGATATLKILSNLADRSLVTVSAEVPCDALAASSTDGDAMRDRIIRANDLALADRYRAATHNKGIMNGVDALAIATGNDWRALEAGVHAYAARDGSYRALTRWSRAADGGLRGELTLPLKLGTVGGSLRANPAAVAGLCIAGVESARELGELAAAVGLAQNLAALRALVSDGIQKGHMRLHARSVAAAAGVPAQHTQAVVGAMIESGEVREWKARQLLEDIEAGARMRDAGRKARGSGNAAGKVILLGEHAVVYGYTAIALPLESALTARVYEAHGGIRLRIADWDIDQSVDREHATGAAEILALILRRLGLDEESLTVEVDARVPPAMGLGSSAALAVAIIRALDDAFRLGMGEDAVNELAFDCEKLAHGTPSGIDNAVAVSGKPIVYCKDGNPRVRPMSLPSRPPLVVAASGTRGETRAQVENVRRLYDAQPDVVEPIFRSIDGLSRRGASALQAGDYPRLGRLMNICHGLLNALQVSTPLLEEMIDIARAHGALGAKLTGAGGGGSIVALCPGRAEAVARALDTAGFRIIETQK